MVMKVSPTEMLTVVAGNGIRGFSGDGGPATAASLNQPHSVTVDAAGNLYIADRFNHRIRKVSPDGIITTVAGTGEASFSGDEGPATSASLNQPFGIAVDATGNLYIADRFNHRIRKVSPDGIITTVAGTGEASFSGDEGPAISASLNQLFGIAVDATGNLYIADLFNHRIRKVSPDGIITTVAGTGEASFSGDEGPATSASLNLPFDITVDAAGNLYIADKDNHRIRKVDTAGIITTVAGTEEAGFSGDGGPATDAKLNFPRDVAVDVTGKLYIADTENFLVRKVSADGIISTVAGNGIFKFAGDGGPATSALMNNPTSVALDAAGNLYIADLSNSRIRKVSPGGVISTVAGNEIRGFSGDGGLATSASLNLPRGVAFDTAGNLYIADWLNQRIRKVSPGGIISTVAGNGERGFSGDGGPAISASLNQPFGIAVDATDNLYIADRFNHRIRKVSPGGIISTVAGNGERGFSGDGGPATSTSLNRPLGVTVDAADNLYIADTERPPESTPKCDGGCGRQPLHRRHAEQPHPQGQRRRDHDHRGRQWRLGLFRRWRAGHQRFPKSTPRGGGRYGRQPLLCRYIEQSYPGDTGGRAFLLRFAGSFELLRSGRRAALCGAERYHLQLGSRHSVLRKLKYFQRQCVAGGNSLERIDADHSGDYCGPRTAHSRHLFRNCEHYGTECRSSDADGHGDVQRGDGSGTQPGGETQEQNPLVCAGRRGKEKADQGS